MTVESLRELCALCAQQPDHAAWDELWKRLQPTAAKSIYRVARQFGTTRIEDVEDMLQEFAAKLAGGALRNIPQEDDDSKILAYVAVAAANTARDHYRARHAGKRSEARTGSLDTALIEAVCGTVGDGGREVLMQSIDRHLEADTRGRSVFWLYYRQGYTAAEIARIPSVELSTKGVETLILRLTRAVRERVNPSKDEGNNAARPSR